MMTVRVLHGKEDYLKPSVFLSRRVPGPVLTELSGLFELSVHEPDRVPTRNELLAGVAGVEGLVAMLTDRVDAELLDAAGPRLRVVANHAVGFDNVDLDAATERGVVVTNTPDVLTAATAELTLALVLDAARRVSEGDRLVRAGTSWEWSPTFMLGRGLGGRTLGIVGLGRIGRAVAELAGAFGMEIVYTGGEGPYERVDLPELLARAHVVSVHCPLTPETHHLVGAAELRAIRRDAILVNTARGPIVDEAALAEALASGEIAGAGLDVYEREPEVAEALRRLPTVVLAPHLGSATEEARTAMGMLCVDALRSVLLEGRVPANALNQEALRRRQG
jgi:glyoxylate reductase